MRCAAPPGTAASAASRRSRRRTRGCGAPGRRRRVADAWREVTIPAGTQLAVMLDTRVGSDTSRVEEPVKAHLTRAIRVRGETALAEGARVSGVVTDATRSAKVKGRAHVALRFDSVTPRGDDRALRDPHGVGRDARPRARRRRTRSKIGAPAAGGAIIGALRRRQEGRAHRDRGRRRRRHRGGALDPRQGSPSRQRRGADAAAGRRRSR